MVVNRAGRWGRRLALACLLLLITSCDGDPVLVPADRGPFLYLILGQSTYFQGRPGNPPGQYAVLLTMGAPTDPVVLRSGQRFELRRTGDSAIFGWEDLGRDGVVGSRASSGTNLLRDVTHHLPAHRPASGLGADSLAPLTTYALTIEIDGVVMQGSVRTPGELDVRRSEDGQRLSWDGVEGAAGYRLSGADLAVHYTTSTSYPLTDADRAERRVTIQALEANAWRYLVDDDMVRSGIDQGRGVFGGMTEQVIEW